MIVSNHISWMDIPVLGSIMELSFIAKSEVNEMPGANLLSRLQRTIPIVFDEQSNRRHVTKEIQSQVRNNFLNTLHVRKNDIIKAD